MATFRFADTQYHPSVNTHCIPLLQLSVSHLMKTDVLLMFNEDSLKAVIFLYNAPSDATKS